MFQVRSYRQHCIVNFGQTEGEALVDGGQKIPFQDVLGVVEPVDVMGRGFAEHLPERFDEMHLIVKPGIMSYAAPLYGRGMAASQGAHDMVQAGDQNIMLTGGANDLQESTAESTAADIAQPVKFFSSYQAFVLANTFQRSLDVWVTGIH